MIQCSNRKPKTLCISLAFYTFSLLSFVCYGEQIPESNDTSLPSKCRIGFENLKLSVKSKKKGERLILDGSIKGEVSPGRMLAIMGPSGSGKSTILSAITGSIKSNSKMSLSGRRYVNDLLLTGDSSLPCAFVQQEVNFFPYMQVRETLDFRAELKLGRIMSKRARDELIDELLETLSLTKSANTTVGNAKVKGLSGGERKRLSIACEMISTPNLIILDEPTSGLDSSQAEQIIKTLRDLADSGKTIITVIHQPSQKLLSMFDDLLLVSEGRQMYFGPVREVRSYFDKLGFKCPQETGTAEHIIECISPGKDSGKSSPLSFQERLDMIADKASQQANALNLRSSKGQDEIKTKSQAIKLKRLSGISNKRPVVSIFRQFRALFKRAFKDVFRAKGPIILKILQQVTVAIVYGGIYKLSMNQASIMDRVGLLSLVVIGTVNMSLASTIRSFPKEKAIISPEILDNLYGTAPYFVAKLLAEFPLIATYSSLFSFLIYKPVGLQNGRFKNFLAINTMCSLLCTSAGFFVSAISGSEDVALALFPPTVFLSIIFDGKFVSIENTPKYLKWLPKIGLVRWAYEGLAANELKGLTFVTPAGQGYQGRGFKSGEEALEAFNINIGVKESIMAQTNLIGAAWIGAFLALKLTKPKYLVMQGTVDGISTNR